MKATIVNMQGEKVGTKSLPEAIFAAPVRVDLMHQAFVRQLANARLGTRKTKTRSEVRGGGRKPWRQKGTGRARHGSNRSAQWVGGGKIHTPRPRDFSKKMPRKMRRAALRSALSVKASADSIVLVENLHLDEAKTSRMAETLHYLVGESTALVLIPDSNQEFENVARSTKNLADVKVLHASYLNVRDLLGYDKIVVPLETLDVITKYLS